MVTPSTLRTGTHYDPCCTPCRCARPYQFSWRRRRRGQQPRCPCPRARTRTVAPLGCRHLTMPLIGDSCVFVSHRRPFRKSIVLQRPPQSTDGASSTYRPNSDRGTRFAGHNPNPIVGNWNAPTLSAITILHSNKKRALADCQGVTKTQGLNRD